MSHQVEGYAIEVCGESESVSNNVCERFPTWDEAIKRLGAVVQEKSDQYNANPICLLRLSSQQICNTTGVASVYSFTGSGIIIQIRALFKETSSLQALPCALSSSAN